MKKSYEDLLSADDRGELGEVTTPQALVDEMLAKIPEHIFKSSTTTFLDPCMGNGTFVIALIKKLREYGHTMANIESRIYGGDINLRFYNKVTKKLLRNYNFKNIYHGDSLKKKFNMKFDIVIGNPPFGISGDEREISDKNQWLSFATASMNWLKPGGNLLFVSPNPMSRHQRSKKADYSVFLDNQVDFVDIISEQKKKEYFPGIGAYFAIYCVSNCKKHSPTKIGFGDDTIEMYLSDVNLSPSDNPDNILEFLQVVNNAEYMDARADYAQHSQKFAKDGSEYSEELTDTHRYPFFRTNSARGYTSWPHPTLQNVPKVCLFIFSPMHTATYNDNVGFGENLKYIPVENEESGKKLELLLKSKFYRFLDKNFRQSKAFNWKHIPFFPWDEFTCDADVYSYFNLSEELINTIERVIS